MAKEQISELLFSLYEETRNLPYELEMESLIMIDKLSKNFNVTNEFLTLINEEDW